MSTPPKSVTTSPPVLKVGSSPLPLSKALLSRASTVSMGPQDLRKRLFPASRRRARKNEETVPRLCMILPLFWATCSSISIRQAQRFSLILVLDESNPPVPFSTAANGLCLYQFAQGNATQVIALA